MIATAPPAIDVFVSYAAPESAAANAVVEGLAGAGMAVRRDLEILESGSKWESSLRKALIDSDAFVLVIDSNAGIAPNPTFELGAAMTIHKPVFVVREREPSAEVPQFLRRFEVFPITAIDELAESIRDACQPLTDSQRQSLVNAYQRLRIPVDQLLSDPLSMEQLAKEFQSLSGRSGRPAHLASELLRMRKAGRLPRFRARKAS
jgi:hypothetical protein